MAVKKLLFKFGATPRRSFKVFVLGILLFFSAMTMIFVGSQHWLGWQALGLALGSVGFCVAAWGYLGLLANRLAQFFSRD